MNRLVIFIASGAYTGYYPLASGTAGTIIGIGLYLLVAPFNVNSTAFIFYILALALLTFIGIWSSGKAEAIYKEKDSHKIVIDEIVGYMYAMILVPTSLSMLIVAFLIFRIFDVIKPFPLRRLQRLPGGTGIMIDDVLAGLYSCILIHVFFL